MGAIVKEIYDAFRSAGVSDEEATAAARLIPTSDELATKTDLGEFRAESHAEIGELRAEVRAEIGELRAEVRAEIAKLRTELHTEIAKLRAELHAEIAKLRAELRTEMKELELRITIKLYAALGAAVALIKALDFLID